MPNDETKFGSILLKSSEKRDGGDNKDETSRGEIELGSVKVEKKGGVDV